MNTHRYHHTERPRIPLEQRFVEGTITKVGQDYLNLELPNNQYGRLHKEHADKHLQRVWDNQKAGTRLTVFLLNPSERDRDFWKVSQAWVNREFNPWFSNPPTVGHEIEGIVVSYVSDYAAVVLLQNKIDAFLHIKQVPQTIELDEVTPLRTRFRDIREEIFIGDKLRGEITRADPNRLKVDIDLRPIVRKKQENAKQCRSKLDKDQKDEPAVEISDQAFDLNGIILWLVDDDLRFRQVMREWLTNKGAKCCPLSGDRELQAAIASVNAGDCASPTHILLDGELAHSGEWEACRKLLEEYLPEVPTCLCSSHSNYLRDIDLPGFQKPVDLTSLCDWLQNGILPNKNVLELQGQSIETNPLWVDEALSRDFICDAGKFLSNICDGSIPAVLWAERVRPGVYEIVAFHGLDQDRLVQTRYAFGQSLLANVIESRVHESLPVSAIGPLKEILPLGCSRVYGLSLEP